MKIKIKSGKFRLSLVLPLGLAGFVIRKSVNAAANRGATGAGQLDKAVVKEMVNALRKAKKYHRGLELVSVTSADGEEVLIKL